MGQSFYVYNNGDLRRKDNTLQFISSEGEKRDIPIERVSDIYVMSEMTFNTAFINYISLLYRKFLSERKTACRPAARKTGRILYGL